MSPLDQLRTLTFDAFSTVLDLGGPLTPFLAALLQKKGSSLMPEEAWARWRYRQRIEQYQDNLLMMGHPGYLDSSRRALMYMLRASGVPFDDADIAEVMKGWQQLTPFPEVISGLHRMKSRYRLVILSNGEPEYLDHLVKNRIKFDFDDVISVNQVGAFKPYPGVYRVAARQLGAEPQELLMVSANSFDVMGARSCGFRGAYVNRYSLPYEETPYRPDLEVRDFTELAERLGV